MTLAPAVGRGAGAAAQLGRRCRAAAPHPAWASTRAPPAAACTVRRRAIRHHRALHRSRTVGRAPFVAGRGRRNDERRPGRPHPLRVRTDPSWQPGTQLALDLSATTARWSWRCERRLCAPKRPTIVPLDRSVSDGGTSTAHEPVSCMPGPETAHFPPAARVGRSRVRVRRPRMLSASSARNVPDTPRTGVPAVPRMQGSSRMHRQCTTPPRPPLVRSGPRVHSSSFTRCTPTPRPIRRGNVSVETARPRSDRGNIPFRPGPACRSGSIWRRPRKPPTRPAAPAPNDTGASRRSGSQTTGSRIEHVPQRRQVAGPWGWGVNAVYALGSVGSPPAPRRRTRSPRVHYPFRSES